MQRCVVAVARPLTDMAEALGYLITLHPHKAWAIVRAWATFIAWHRGLAAKRKAVVRKRRAEGIYPFSIVVRYLCGRREFKKMM